MKNTKFLLAILLLIFAFILPSMSYAGAPNGIISANVGSSAQKTLTAKEQRKAEKMEKFLNSKVGQWLIKKAVIKAENKKFRQELKKHKGDKQAQRILREKHQDNVNKLSGNLRLAVIFGIIGIILSLIPGIWWLGTICIIIALVFLLLEVI